VVDYGHPLRFGTFLTPVNAPASRPVELAVFAEQLGFDLVTFQDHPYQPSFTDAWTLLTWVAARTEKIQLAGNVLNLPLRPPAVLARAAAGLDLLSGGRLALGLGAGGFWDPIVAMGGDRLTPGQAITALGEAVDVIRGIWDEAERRPLKIEGERYRVVGAKRGPSPAHAIPIWIGALKPRALRLIGRKADGWLPSLAYLPVDAIGESNDRIDQAATAAGRDPREVVRLLNIGPDRTVAQIADLALAHGFSTFILATDDPRALERFAAEVAPAVREVVAAHRSDIGTPTGDRVRNSLALAKRRPHIDYDGIPADLAERAVEPGDPGYTRYTAAYLRGGAPGLVLRPVTVDQVSSAVRFATAHRDVPLGVFSAGHGVSGRSINDGGLVIDVGALNGIEILDEGTGRVRIGPGARWVDVAKVLTPHGLAITSGDYGGVGVGGLATAGGIGWFAREHGLTIDHLRAVDVVLADGTVAHADATENADLFWAVRGAGANVGIVVSFEFEAARVGMIAFAQLTFATDDLATFLQRWGTAIETADRSVTGEMIVGRPQGGRFVVQAMLVVDSDDPDTVIARLQPIADIAPLIDQSVSLASYADVMDAMVSDGPQRGSGEPLAHSGLIDHLTPAFAAETTRMLQAGASYFFQIRAVGGAVADVPDADTAYGWRRANFSVTAMGTTASRLDSWWERLLPYFDGLYLSFETATGNDVLARAFPPATLTRLRGIKRRYDPTGLFRDNFFIAPAV
jgi:FAD/FMN-containing dehydrogenase